MKTTTEQDAFTQQALRELNRMLDEEMAKPDNERDYEKIAEISCACSAAMGDREKEEEFIEESFCRTEQKMLHPKITMRGRVRIAVAAGAAAVLGVANIFTVTAYNTNVFSALVKISDGSFALNPQGSVELPATDSDPYGIKAECAKYNITEILAPTYLPEGFTLEEVSHNYTEGYLNQIYFNFCDAHHNVIQILYDQWDNETLYGSIPCDDYNLTETTIDGYPAIISQEDGQYVLVFRNDTNLETHIWMDGVDYKEGDKLVASLD